MRLAQTRIRTRTAWTLIELLVVMAIIAVLVSLIAAAVMRVLSQGPEAENSSVIRQLDASVALFKQDFGGRNPPSRIKLGFYPDNRCYGSTPLDVDSVDFLKHMFPRCYDTWVNAGIPWGPGVTPSTPAVTLEGEECLVFFLGGLTTNTNPPACLGFSSDPNNPMAPPFTGEMRRGPYFQFKANRLVAGPDGFQAYNDPFGTPYAYYSSYKTLNGYNRYGSNDCPSLAGLQGPYVSSTSGATGTQYYKGNTYQIISAGLNKTFGPGGLWTAQNPTNKAGEDDFSNFNGLRLGAGPQ
jgi:type II secretory pathway pseudopilin PulG